MAFRGFPPEAFEFYRSLEAENTKAFWDAHRAEYKAVVKEPVEAMCESFDAYGDFHLFRPHNDLRFSKTKPPYKVHQGAFAERERGSGLYFQLGPKGLFVGAGFYTMASDQLEKYRVAVDDEMVGGELVSVVERMRSGGVAVESFDQLKTAPRGWPKDHPRIDLLRRKGIHAGREFKEAKWMHTAKTRERVESTWTEVIPLCEWFDTYVGPSELPPDDRWG